MSLLREFRAAYLVLMITVLSQAVLYPHLPDPMPIHWSAAGIVNGWMAKPLGAWLAPLIFVAATALMTVMPILSPANFSMQPFVRFYRHVTTAFAVFAFWLVAVTDAIALGMPLSLPRHVLTAIGLLSLFLGNWMGKLTQNFFFGIRTPWTIADADVWARTHRLAGPLIMLAGLATIIGAWISPRVGFVMLIGGAVAGFLLPMAYSWWITPAACATTHENDA